MRYFDSNIETPCIVVNKQKVEKNILRAQQMADQNHCKLRPHIKTHKSAELAKWQVACGASGITCAKITEAEVMAAGGINDIFVAYPLVGDFRIRKAVALHKRLQRFILAVDSLEAATALSEAAVQEGIAWEVRLEIDTGLRRTGVQRENLKSLAAQIAKLQGLNITGIYTFKSLVYKGEATTNKALAGQEEAELLLEAAELLREMGMTITDISAGSTPTAEAAAKTGMVTEVRPGTYIFNDYMMWKEGACELDDIAAYVVATVVSVPCKEYAVIDGGTKTFSTDIQLNTAPYFYSGYAVVTDNDDLVLDRLNEEHGILRSRKKDTGLEVGQQVVLYPVHICTTVNLQNHIYLQDQDRLEKIKVDARGMLV